MKLAAFTPREAQDGRAVKAGAREEQATEVAQIRGGLFMGKTHRGD
jgi:hypothetical protein